MIVILSIITLRVRYLYVNICAVIKSDFRRIYTNVEIKIEMQGRKIPANSARIKSAKEHSPAPAEAQGKRKAFTILRCQSAAMKQPPTNVHCDQRGLDSGKAPIRLHCKMLQCAIFAYFMVEMEANYCLPSLCVRGIMSSCFI